ncbi:MAG: replicative DNA helicase [Candidatus Hydrogenedentes bacterium]|nr:replicative DNA helicase [Candidatus Hydrogenedentota bacterium]
MAVNRKPDIPLDRVPPQNVDAERSVLGAMLLNPDAVGSAVEILRDDASVFYVEAHQHIYHGIISLYRENTPIDSVTLVEQLTRDGRLEQSGNVSYVADLTNAVPTSANIEHYARIVLDTALMRRIISVCSLVAGEAYGYKGDVASLLDRAESHIMNIGESRQLNPVVKVSDLVEESVKRIEQIIKSRSGFTGLPTGFSKLDQLLSGMQPSDMIIMAARPSVGKTAFALNIASHVGLREKKNVLIFSLEMAKEQLVTRMLCMEGHINSRRLRDGFLASAEFPKLQTAAAKLHRASVYIDDTPNISVLELKSKARRHKQKHDNQLDLVIVDYLQLMRCPGVNEGRQAEIAEISRSIKGLARELSCPVIALSQLNREADKDDTGTPKLSQLRESGAIEQDADVVLMLWRPPAHKRGKGEEPDPEDRDNDKLIHVNIAKQRNGPTGKFDLFFDRDVQRFMDPASDDRAPRMKAGNAPSADFVDDSEGSVLDTNDEEEISFDDDDDAIPF